MNFIVTLPSLEHRALVTIAIMLWKRGNVRYKMPKRYVLLETRWQIVDEIVAERVSRLPLPLLLSKKLLDITEQVGLQILSWVKFHVYFCKFVTECPSTLVWTPHGTIDNNKTAKILIKDETIDVKMRFLLACVYCLEDEILNLQREFEFPLNRLYYYARAHFWSKYTKEDELKYSNRVAWNQTSYEALFEFSAVRSGNVEATKYFSVRMRPEIAETFKTATAKDVAQGLFDDNAYYSSEEQRADVFFFLLSTMNIEQQAEIFQSFSYHVLTTLLVWPRQSLFLEMANDKWNFLSKESYECLLHKIVHRMSCKRSYLKNIFLEYWQQTPQNYKQFITHDKKRVGCLLLKLYEKENERIIKVILKDSSILTRKNLIFSDVGRGIYKYLVCNEKWDSVEYLIQECISSPQEMTKFKDQIIKNVTVFSSGNKFMEEHQWNKFLKMIKDFINIYRKRKIIENNNAPSEKIFCEDIQK